MTTIKELLLSIRKLLNNALEARMLIQHQLNMTHEELLLYGDKILTDKECVSIEKMARRRLENEPIAYITGAKEFYGLDFKVTKDTLIPRPDSETLIEAVLGSYGKEFGGTILDLGTGSGCLIITLLKYLPKAKGIAVDILEKTLGIAKKNAELHNLSERIKFFHGSWNDLLNIKADIIVSNPPYIETEEIEKLENNVKNYEPTKALDGGIDGLDCYKEIFELSKKWLQPNGNIFIELGYNQKEALEELARKKGLVVKQNYQDLNNIVRCMKLSN